MSKRSKDETETKTGQESADKTTPTITLPAMRCMECGGETYIRTSETIDIPLLDPETNITYSARRRSFHHCRQCGALRVSNKPAGNPLN